MKYLTWAAAILSVVLIVACGGKEASGSTGSSSPKKEVASNAGGESSGGAVAATNRKGKLIFKQYCVACHGADGKLGVSGAKDLSASTISLEERINQVTNGKGLMTPYKDILSEDQIKAVCEYLEELRT